MEGPTMRSHAFQLGTSEDKENWRTPDLSVLDNRRGPVPAVPLAKVPQPWQDWIADTERATGAPADYVLQSVLAGVAAVCGAGVRVRVTPAWDEPLVLWQAVVGEPSTGKSAALAPMRRLLDLVEQERRAGDEERRAARASQGRAGQSGTGQGGKDGDAAPFVPSQVVANDSDPVALADIVSANPRGVLLWRDGPAAWPAGWSGATDDDEGDSHRTTWLAAWEAGPVTAARPRQPARSLPRFPVSILETIRPERLMEALRSGDDSLAARFLVAWPGPQPYRALEVVERSRDEEILQRLRALSRLAASADDPCVLAVDDRGRAALDKVLATLHAERQNVEGLEAAWIGKSRSLIVRLAASSSCSARSTARSCGQAPSAPSRSRPPRRCGATTYGRMPRRCSTAPSCRTMPSAYAASPAGCWTSGRRKCRGRRFAGAPSARRRPPKKPSMCWNGWPISASCGLTLLARGSAGRPRTGWSIRRSPKPKNR
jgi:hypothetical protein